MVSQILEFTTAEQLKIKSYCHLATDYCTPRNVIFSNVSITLILLSVPPIGSTIRIVCEMAIFGHDCTIKHH